MGNIKNTKAQGACTPIGGGRGIGLDIKVYGVGKNYWATEGAENLFPPSVSGKCVYIKTNPIIGIGMGTIAGSDGDGHAAWDAEFKSKEKKG